MPYLTSTGDRIECDEPAAVLAAVAANAFGGPYTPEAYTVSLQERSELATGHKLTATEPAAVLAFLEGAGTLQKTN